MSENSIFAVFFFPSAAAVVIYFMKYLAAMRQAKAQAGQDEAYRQLAQAATAAQTATAAELASNRIAITEMQSRLLTIEKILNAVE